MKSKIVYTFTFERFNEFKAKKAANDEVITAITYADTNNPIQIEESNNYYVDISNLYKANTESNNMLIENIMHKIYLKENVHVILNENSKNRFSQDFATSFDEFKPIQTIYEERDLVNYEFINIDNDGLKKIEKSLTNDLIGHNAFKKDFLNKLKDFPILYKLGEMKIFSLLICGNPGVGKTELARILHKTMYKESKMIKINLGNYKTQGALNSLIGSPIGFIGSERGGELSNKIRNSDSKVILIDEFEKADNYIKGMDRLISDFVLFPYSNNTVLNLILNEKKIFAEQHGILYKCTVEQTDFRFMDDIDITTIFSNLLENALSASALCKTNKEVSVIISSHNNFVIINVKNSCNSYTKCGTFSSKDYGTGLYNVENSVKKYEGFLKISYSQTEFNCNVVLSNTH